MRKEYYSYIVSAQFIRSPIQFFVEKHDSFQYPFKRKQDDESLRDVHDGTAFSDLMTPGNFLSDHNSTGLVLSTDGVPIFKSSKGSIWPVYLMSTSIPPHKRTLAENLVVASLWFGPTKPNMTIMLEPILSHISAMEKGIKDSSSSVVVRVKLVMAIFDLPAKAAATTPSSTMENLVAFIA